MIYIRFFVLLLTFIFSSTEICGSGHAAASSGPPKKHAGGGHVEKKTHSKEEKTPDRTENIPKKLEFKKTINIYGSSTVSAILSKYIDDIELNTNIKINLVTSNSKDGLVALKNGDADIAALSTNLDSFTRQIPGLEVKSLKSFCVGDTNIVFIVNKKNNVKSARVDDIKAVLAGVVTNWKDLRSSLDEEILVVTEYPGGGVRNFVESDIMYQPLTIDLKQMINSSQVIEVVGKVPNALGISALVLVEDEEVDVIRTERSIFLPLYLVAKAKTDDVSLLVDAIRKYNIGGNVKKYIDQEKMQENPKE
jgi:ABC-type phosphate transport system substrate-binding protein